MILRHVGQTFHVRIAEWLLACVLTSWGLILLRPEPTLASTTLQALAALASETAWGWGCLLVGGCRLVALFINGSWVPPSYHLRSLTSFLSILFWTTIVYGLAASGQATTGLAVYPWLLVADLICLYRTARDARLAMIAVGEEGKAGAGY